MADNDFPESPFEFAMFDWIENSGQPVADIVEHKMQLVETADKGGFYAWHIAEHQGTPLSVDISPSLMLAAAIQRTKNIRVGALTFCLPWYNPYRLYNEICMLDQMSRGRIELGVGRGVSLLEAKVYGINDLEDSRSRYREALDIFMTACGTDVLNYKGQYHSYEELELHNKPYQSPYPPLWFPSSSKDVIQFTASHGYNTVLPGSAENIKGMLEQYREVWVEHKDDPGRHNAHVAAPRLGRTHHILVADTDAEAEALAGPAHSVWSDHIQHLWKKNGQSAPISTARGGGGADRSVVLGEPKAVIQQLVQSVKESTVNYMMLVFSFGDLKPEHAQHSLELFIKDVMPAVRSELGAVKEAAAG